MMLRNPLWSTTFALALGFCHLSWGARKISVVIIPGERNYSDVPSTRVELSCEIVNISSVPQTLSVKSYNGTAEIIQGTLMPRSGITLASKQMGSIQFQNKGAPGYTNTIPTLMEFTISENQGAVAGQCVYYWKLVDYTGESSSHLVPINGGRPF